VVTFGCSYSGMLSSFFRNQFPHLAMAAVAGSSPILAKLDFPEYDATVKTVLEKYPSSKYNNCASATVNFFKLVKSYAIDQRSLLVNTLNICEKLDFYLSDLISALSGFVQGVVQTNNADNGYPAQTMCTLLNQFPDSYNGFVNYFKNQLNGQCLVTNPYPNSMYNTSSDRSWLFQTCTEYGFFQTDIQSGIFGSSLDLKYYLNGCARVFGANLVPDIDTTNYYFGGLSGGSNILYTNGLNDPWANLGLTKNSTNALVYMYDGAHCAPFHKASTQDPSSLIQTRLAIKSFVKKQLLSE